VQIRSHAQKYLIKLIKKHGITKVKKSRPNDFDEIKTKSKYRLLIFNDIKYMLYNEEKEIIFLFLFHFHMKSLEICYDSQFFINEKFKIKFFHSLFKIENKLMINLIGKK